ncbi:DUF4333 domain-containing protein [Paraconexibacter sp.]|uniref:DUF4333 domain-containing protein n=1 Tax=Paraconexibacter sp. TaxID=2949640 RepID=UPI0035698014
MTRSAPRRRAAVALALALAGAVGAAGCGAEVSVGGKTLNTGEAETQIAAGLTEQLGGDVSVSCPEDVKVEKGATFECEATDPQSGETATVTVEQKDDEGNIRWEVAQ